VSKILTDRQWIELGRRMFSSWGTPDDIAETVVRSLVESDLAGVASHGVMRIPSYHSFIKAGWLHPANRPQVGKESPSTAVVDGNWGFGQPAAQQATRLGMDKARAQGIAAVSILHAGHIGRLGEYAEMAAHEGLIAMIMASGGPTGGVMVPYGGLQRVMSTNPIAAGVPSREHDPFVMDYATTVVAAGKIDLLADPDARIPEGWVIDADGQPATWARQFRQGGGMLPFGKHKGYGLALLVELLCGALSGAGCSERPDRIVTQGLGGNACFLIVIDPEHFSALDPFYESVDGLFDRIKHVKPAEGFERVKIPGEPEMEKRAINRKAGVGVSDAAWDEICAVAGEHNVQFDDVLRSQS
jgi:LDH2 family malate/lactate/ureidoglycolate dehydrogenase